MLQLPPFRYVGNNAALYAGAAVAPVVDPYLGSVVFLSGFNGVDAATTAADEATAKAITFAGNAQLDTAQSKFGTSSLLLDGTGDYVTLADSPDWDFGTGPFTIEGWFRFAATPVPATLLAQWPTGFLFYFESGQGLFFRSGSIDLPSTKYLWTPPLNTWFHIACDRDGSNVHRIYVDGVMRAKTTGYTSNITGSTAVLAIGSLTPSGFGGYDLNGWVDEVRITKGVARYASDSGYTVPTSAFPRVPVAITSATTFSTNEGTTAIATLTATPGGITWSLVGGADLATFSINAATGALSFNSAPDFEAPSDSDLDNVYIVQVQASNGITSDTKTLSVTVLNVVYEHPLAPLLWAWYLPETLGAGSSAVSQWDDVGAAARHATQATSANQPVVVASAINGLKAIQLVDQSDALALPSMAGLTRGSTFLVLKSVGDVGSGATNGFPMQPTFGGSVGAYPYLSECWIGWMRENRITFPDPTQPLNAWHILSIHSAPSDFRMYINNVLITSTTTCTPTFSATPTIGRQAAEPLGWQGHVAEITHFSHELTTTDRTTEYNRLKTKFGL